MSATKAFVESENTRTEPPLPIATKIAPFPRSYARPTAGVEIVATTEFVASEITLTWYEPQSATKISPFPLSYARSTGLIRNGILDSTVFAKSDNPDKLLELKVETK